MANTVSSFFQCYPSAGSLSRSVVQEGSGGKTLLVGGIAAIVIVNLKGLFLQLKDFLFYFRINKLECVSLLT